MVAGHTGKIGIIKNARDAPTAVVTRYAKIRDDIRTYLCSPGRSRSDLDGLRNKYAEMADNPGLTEWSRQDARLSVDVLNSLARMGNVIAGGRFVAPPAKQPPLAISGVSVSISLNVMQVRQRAGKDEVGGVLFRLTKADDETEGAAAKRRDIGSYAATLAFMQAQANPLDGTQTHHQLCASFDIQCEEVHQAPRNYATRAKDIENACRFIEAMWEKA